MEQKLEACKPSEHVSLPLKRERLSTSSLVDLVWKLSAKIISETKDHKNFSKKKKKKVRWFLLPQ